MVHTLLQYCIYIVGNRLIGAARFGSDSDYRMVPNVRYQRMQEGLSTAQEL